MRGARSGAFSHHFLPPSGIGNVELHLHPLTEVEFHAQPGVDSLDGEGFPWRQFAFQPRVGTLHRGDPGFEQRLEPVTLQGRQFAMPRRQLSGQCTALVLLDDACVHPVPGGGLGDGQAGEGLLAQFFQFGRTLAGTKRNRIGCNDPGRLLFTAVELDLQGVFKRRAAQR
ncbi:hypothetical protein D3C84_290800 [compost metagenome]